MRYSTLHTFYIFTTLGLFLSLSSCRETPIPKPKGYLALEFPTPKYELWQQNTPYTFEQNTNTTVENANTKISKHWYTLHYPKFKGAIHLSYYPIKNNLRKLTQDAQNLTQQHVVKADEISYHPYVDSLQNIHAMLYEVKGNAASNIQFYVTDKKKHFITGAAYIKNRPKYDSLYPAIKYLEKDTKHLIETLRWQ